jgi:hypothetical protein
MLIRVARMKYRTTYRAIGIDVADICSNARCTTDIVEAEGGYERINFEK